MVPKIKSKSQNRSIIPQPRGNRATKTTCLLILLCIALMYLRGAGNFTSCQIVYSLAIHFVIAQSWHFIMGICEFSEEIAHVNTRYNGEYMKAFNASFNIRNVGLLILAGILCVIFYKDDLLPILPVMINMVMVVLCNLTCCFCGLQDPTPAAISEITEKKHLNVAHGLAWSYYVGYLHFILPELKDKVKQFNEENNNILRFPETWKLHILLPLSCKIYGDLNEADKNISFVREIPPVYKDRAGIKGRVFKNNVYRILDEDHRPYYCIVEYATPLASLHKMSDIASAAFSKEERIQQAKLFYRTLKDILENSVECQSTFRLVIYDASQTYSSVGRDGHMTLECLLTLICTG
ncbi:stimulator of interferon genes protein isoform X2 [Pseudophryne corroboree]|uniref:stimulator of interferon genes protein isoform X2 n=1 Tax=Pseudophryne corroboree TaxID=495146 RepID=UPI003081F3FE